ncbi:MAG: xylose isomerase, partial [Flammeovirgaceae bacterium]|nr:xylose isomerase [Flammeovirgaceae bacterium]
MKRRKFIKDLSLSTSLTLSPLIPLSCKSKENSMFFEIGLAEWSLNKALDKGEITNMDFPSIAKNDYEINIIEYVNQFFMDKATNKKYLNELLSRTQDLGVTN